jgi:hypothetical protein
MRKILILILSVLPFSIVSAQGLVRISGKVTDFNSSPIDSVTIRLKNDKFENVYETLSDRDGNFSMNVRKGTYFCLYAIKEADYGKTRLEYWAWNVPMYKDLYINPQYERMEIYGVNAFEPQVSPHETYMVYFRPMSLTKSSGLFNQKNRKEFQQKAMTNHDTIDIAPIKILSEELTVKINEENSKVLTIQKIMEYTRESYMVGYLIQILKPKEEIVNSGQYDKISIVLHSGETNEIGKGEVFIRKKE